MLNNGESLFENLLRTWSEMREGGVVRVWVVKEYYVRYIYHKIKLEKIEKKIPFYTILIKKKGMNKLKI